MDVLDEVYHDSYFLIYSALYVLYICFDLQIWRINKLKYKYVRFYNCKIRK